MNRGCGQNWCEIGRHTIAFGGIVGIGDGSGSGADGRFACLSCYERWLRERETAERIAAWKYVPTPGEPTSRGRAVDQSSARVDGKREAFALAYGSRPVTATDLTRILDRLRALRRDDVAQLKAQSAELKTLRAAVAFLKRTVTRLRAARTPVAPSIVNEQRAVIETLRQRLADAAHQQNFSVALLDLQKEFTKYKVAVEDEVDAAEVDGWNAALLAARTILDEAGYPRMGRAVGALRKT